MWTHVVLATVKTITNNEKKELTRHHTKGKKKAESIAGATKNNVEDTVPFSTATNDTAR